ncbi:MAG TPA: hypothetical protein VEQ18_05245, partial [Candidatus Nitrosocosmicus sp.]|nr:hypothetical protein [Candidatus Nitrosocosmicus sp.]
MKEQTQNSQKEPYYIKLSSALVEKTEDMIHDLKRGLPSAKRRQLNRSKFFELLLEALTEDYVNNQQTSNVKQIVSFGRSLVRTLLSGT